MHFGGANKSAKSSSMFKGQMVKVVLSQHVPNASSKAPRFLSIHASENGILETTEPWGEKIQGKPSQRKMLHLAPQNKLSCKPSMSRSILQKLLSDESEFLNQGVSHRVFSYEASRSPKMKIYWEAEDAGTCFQYSW